MYPFVVLLIELHVCILFSFVLKNIPSFRFFRYMRVCQQGASVCDLFVVVVDVCNFLQRDLSVSGSTCRHIGCETGCERAILHDSTQVRACD